MVRLCTVYHIWSHVIIDHPNKPSQSFVIHPNDGCWQSTIVKDSQLDLFHEPTVIALLGKTLELVHVL
jgi:hypothetical protein